MQAGNGHNMANTADFQRRIPGIIQPGGVAQQKRPGKGPILRGKQLTDQALQPQAEVSRVVFPRQRFRRCQNRVTPLIAKQENPAAPVEGGRLLPAAGIAESEGALDPVPGR